MVRALGDGFVWAQEWWDFGTNLVSMGVLLGMV